MAIDRSAGTEIIRTVHLEQMNSGAIEELIFGVQHHIYTVLSVIVFANTSAGYIHLNLIGYDTLGGTSAQTIHIFHAAATEMLENKTYVFNDKFSFMGHEPVDFSAGMDSIAKQDAIADQGSAVAQKLMIGSTDTSSNLDVTCTFIDQNNA